MTTVMPRDSNENAIPALRLKASGAHTISVTGSSARNSTAFDAATRIVSLFATVPIYVKFGDSSVTATTSDHYYPANFYYDIAIGGDETGHYTHLAAIRTSEDGSLYISEKE